jgi:hypothetical protein
MQYRCAKFIATRYLQSAGERNVTKGKKFKATASETPQKRKRYFLKNECFWVFRFGESCFLGMLKNECFFVSRFGKYELRSN